MITKNTKWWIAGAGLLILAPLMPLVFEQNEPSPDHSKEQTATGGQDAARVQGTSKQGPSRHSAKNLTPRPATEPVRPVSRNPNPTNEECLRALSYGAVEADRVKSAMFLARRASQEGLAEKAVPALIEAMEHDEAPQVWLVCAQALGSFGAEAEAAVPALMKWFDHVTMRDVAVDALGKIGGSAQPAIASIAAVATDPAQRFLSRRKAITALVKIGGPDQPAVAATLEAAAADPDRRIGIAVAQALKARKAEATELVTTPSSDQGVVLASTRGGGRSLTALGPQGGEPGPASAQRGAVDAAVESPPKVQQVALAGRRETDRLSGRGAPASKSDAERQEIPAELEAIKEELLAALGAINEDRQKLATELEAIKQERQELTAELEKFKKERQQLVAALGASKSPESPGRKNEVDKPLAGLPPQSGTVGEGDGPGDSKADEIPPSSKPASAPAANPAPVSPASVATKPSAPEPKTTPATRSEPKPKTVRHKIARGDTLSKIGKKYGVCESDCEGQWDLQSEQDSGRPGLENPGEIGEGTRRPRDLGFDLNLQVETVLRPRSWSSPSAIASLMKNLDSRYGSEAALGENRGYMRASAVQIVLTKNSRTFSVGTLPLRRPTPWR